MAKWSGIVLAMMLLLASLGTATSARADTTRYYLALGDSLSITPGGGATPGHGYVPDIYNWASPQMPGLVLEDLGCGGDSTTRMINGGNCSAKYATGNQLGDAVAFLQSHPGQVSFVTIDVGGDDIVGCAIPTINSTCVQKALTNVATNMQTILTALRNAGGNVPIVGMTYYDPILAFYLNGPDGQATARSSIDILKSLNKELSHAYRQFHVTIADVQRTFQSTNWSMHGSFQGQTLPVNVANICNWTHMCEANPNIHTNDVGHQLIATTYERHLRGVVKHH
jgi:hypothetical protein